MPVKCKHRSLGGLVALCGLALGGLAAATLLATAPSPVLAGAPQAGSAPQPLRIVVVEGEDAVNIIQQKSAVAPVIDALMKGDMYVTTGEVLVPSF